MAAAHKHKCSFSPSAQCTYGFRSTKRLQLVHSKPPICCKGIALKSLKRFIITVVLYFLTRTPIGPTGSADKENHTTRTRASEHGDDNGYNNFTLFTLDHGDYHTHIPIDPAGSADKKRKAETRSEKQRS